MKSKIDWIRRSQRVIRMVSELHRMGHQRLRIMPYLHPLAWRLAVAPRDVFFSNGIAFPISKLNDEAVYSSASGNHYFAWEDAKHDDARALAEKFLTRFPSLSERGSGRDWEYAGWLSELLGVLEHGDLLPVVEWEYMKGTPDKLEFLPIWSASGENTWNDGSSDNVAALSSNVRRFPLPPAIDVE